MSVIVEPEAPDLLVVRVSGKVSASEWLEAQQDAGGRLGEERLTSFLVIVENFEGWEGSDWDDMSFQTEHDRHIARMAIVAEEKWKDSTLLFSGKGFRKFEIEYFEPAAIARARAWLAAGRRE